MLKMQDFSEMTEMLRTVIRQEEELQVEIKDANRSGLNELAELDFDEEDEEAKGLQETYNSLLEMFEEYARVAKAAIRKMKRAERDYKSLLVRYKETKCQVEELNEKLTEAYSKIKFL